MARRSWRGRILPFAALVSIVSSCGGGDEDAGETTDSAALSTTANQINRMSRDQIQEGGTMTWALAELPPTFNRHHLDGTLRDNADVMSAVVLSSYTTDGTGTPIWNPDLLAREAVLVTEPRQLVTYEINPRAAWYDGTPITWEDFHWQWRALNGTDASYLVASSTGYEAIESVTMGSHEREVVVTYGTPFADWQALFSDLFPASTMRSSQVFNTGWREPLTSAGPFKLEGIDRTSQTITLVRNERWWGEPAKLDRIVYRVIEPVAVIDALANGEVDFMDIGPDASAYRRATSIAGVDIRVAGGPNFRHITMNGTSPNLQDLRVRRALAMGIDRVAIARALLGPLDFEPRTLDNHILMTNQAGYRDNSGEVGTHDPARAAQLLDEAGWTLQNGVRVRNGSPLEIRFVIPGGVPHSQQESELVQNMLGQLGVQVEIQVVPGGDFFEQYVRPGQFDFTVFSWIGTAYPISSAQSIYAVPTIGADGQLDIQQNYARIGSEEIDRLFAEATSELDRDRATELTNQIDALIWQEVHSLPLYQRPEIIATRSGLANFGDFAFEQPGTYQDIGWVAAP